ncbi:ABC transporter substrate-binding protein [Streptomyces sp. NBC_01618]|uniref:ABC transporter substrate-binding protein n=1 Tax=Streptomyces sp. NBC_01618 TaxID=2975900 RepID=UPI0038681ED2|nr:sugar ABC transporter substrate-binding protein [Streptomyces sp. NBC_01618]
MIKRRMALAAGVAALLVGCGTTSAPATGGDTTIRVQVSGEPEETAGYSAIAKSYELSHPGTKVQLVPVANKSDHLTRLSTAFAGGEPPDVFLINYREYAQFAARGAIEPIGPRLAGVGVDTADYYQQPISAFTYDGQVQCMPQNLSSLVVYYNRTLFAEAGVQAPKPGWTFEQFKEAATRLTGDGVHGLGMDPSIVRLAPFVWSNGGDIVDDPQHPTRLTLNTPAARQALESLVQLVRNDGAGPDRTELAGQDLQARFASGKLAMFLDSRKETPALREVQGLDWDVAALPVTRKPAGVLHSDAYCIARKSKHHSEAARFIAFATGKDGQRITSLSGRVVPSLREVANSSAFLAPVKKPANSQAFLDVLPYLKSLPVLATWPEIEDIADEELARAFHDGAHLDDVIKRIDERTRPLFTSGDGTR